MILPILQLGNPVLYEVCQPIHDFQSESLKNLIENLRDTLADFRERNGFGRGIAAPQIGASERVIYIKMQDESFEEALINPEITERSSEKIEIWDDCFSFPELLVKLERHRSVRVSYQNQAGERKEVLATGDLSELLQHEIDHLNGILSLQRASSWRDIIKSSEFCHYASKSVNAPSMAGN